MAERGARPKVPRWRVRTLHALRALFTPLLPDDYLELINPLWSTQELRGRIERIQPETPNAATIVIKPGWEWEGHEPGQYLRIGMAVDGIHHWRAYSLTSDPARPDGCISITPKLVETGKVSPFLVRHARAGRHRPARRRGGHLRAPGPAAGAHPLRQRRQRHHPDHEHAPLALRRAAPSPMWFSSIPHARGEDVIFGAELRDLATRNPGLRVHEQVTSEMGRMGPHDLDRLCPDWRERETFISGPGDMLDAMAGHWDSHGGTRRPHMERFQPLIGSEDAEHGDGGTIRFVEQRRGGPKRRRHAHPRGRRERRRHAALRLPHGHLPHLRRTAVLGPDPGPAHRQGVGPARRGHPHLRERPRGPSRDSSLNRNRRTP